MTIPFCGDKIAPQKIKPAGDAEAEQPGGRESGRREAGSAEKQMKKLLTTPCRCDNLYKLSLEADREGSGTAEKKNKKVLDKAKEI